MYGYINIDKYELKYKDFIVYKKLYCSVCNALKNHLGLKGCMLTSYDATLFIAIFDGLELTQTEQILSCPLNPFKKFYPRFDVSETAMTYTAFISLFYAYAKTKDNLLDEGKRKYRKRIEKINNNPKYHALLNINENLFRQLSKILDDYFELEKRQTSTFDELSNKMGELFGKAFQGYCTFSNVNIDSNDLFEIGFQIGKWIYLADAIDDLDLDITNRQFNPILHMKDYNELTEQELQDKVIFISNCLIQNLEYRLKQLHLLRNNEIIHNITCFGMSHSIERIIKKRKEKIHAK